MATAAAPQDSGNHGPLAGDTVSRLTGRTFTAPDYMAENHGIVHPSYTASALQFLCRQAILYALHGKPLPEQALHNRQRVYDQLKRTTGSTGHHLADLVEKIGTLSAPRLRDVLDGLHLLLEPRDVE